MAAASVTPPPSKVTATGCDGRYPETSASSPSTSTAAPLGQQSGVRLSNSLFRNKECTPLALAIAERTLTAFESHTDYWMFIFFIEF